MKKARTKGGVSPARSSEGSSRLQTEGENAQEAQRKSKQGRGGVTERMGSLCLLLLGKSRLREQSGDVDQAVQVTSLL